MEPTRVLSAPCWPHEPSYQGISTQTSLDSKVHGANMGPTWGRQDPGGPHVGQVNLAIWDLFLLALICHYLVIDKHVDMLHCVNNHRAGKCGFHYHYDDVIMAAIASQITSLTTVYSTVYSDADQRKHQSSTSLAFVWGTHRGPVNSPHKRPVTRKMFPLDDVIMWYQICSLLVQVTARRLLGHKSSPEPSDAFMRL